MALIEDIKNDLEAGVVKMIHEYRDVLFAEAVRLLNDHHEAEDLVFRVFETILAKIDTYDAKKGGFLSWAKGIMRNEATLMRRGRVAKATIPVDPTELHAQMPEIDDLTEKEILLHSDSELLHEAFKILPKEMQDAMFLHYVSDLSIAEVAKLLKVQPGTVKMRLHRARKFLLHRLEAKMKGKKPLAVLAAILFGAGALFGAWQAVEVILASPSTSSSSTTLTTTKEKSKMSTLKRITLAATAAASVMSMSAPAEVSERITTDYGWTRTYTQDGRDFVVTAYAKPGTYTYTVEPGVTAIDYLVVGGGGSGGYATYGGGGGAGGYLEANNVSVAGVSFLVITVGAGGEKQTSHNSQGNNGNESILAGLGEEPITAYGGGGGGGRSDGNWNGKLGASGGGAGGYSAGGKGGEGTQGFDGADSKVGNAGGGGGGAGGPATALTSGGKTVFCSGGPGKDCDITGETITYAKGGNSAMYKTYVALDEATPGSGGCAGEDITPGGYADALPGTDGIVVIRYAKTSQVTLKVTPGEGTSVSLDGVTFYDEIEEQLSSDSPVKLYAKGESDAMVFTWTGLPDGIEPSADTKTVEFNMPATDLTISVTGKATTLWKLEVSQTEGGTVAGTESGNYPDGTVVDLTATPNENYKFLGWYIGDHCEEESEHLTFALERDTSLVAKFEEKAKYALTIVPSDYGTIAGESGEYYEGTKVTLTATPNEGLVFVGWGDDAAPFGKATEITLTMDAAKTVSAKFGYTLTITPSEYGAIVPEPNGTVFEVGATVMLTATPNENCEFLSWQGNVTGDGATTTVTMDQDRTVAALYKDNKGRSHYEWGWKGEVKNDKGRVTGYIVAYEKPGKYDLEVPKGSTIDYLVVAGGGSGGFATYGGGGGAGGMIYETGVAVSSKTLSITVGKGGDVQTTEKLQGNNGENSSISNGVTQIACAFGGGGGGGRDDGNWEGKEGGSGGGAGGYEVKEGGKGTENQGHDGADSTSVNGKGGGGGGGAGGDAPESKGGSTVVNLGGPGRECDITGEKVVYAVGGASAPNTKCATQSPTAPGSGANAYGRDSDQSLRKPGCDGIVVIRYAARKNGLAIMFY